MLVYQRVFKMGSHLARYGVHPTSKLTGSNHTLLLWRHSFDPKMVLGKICTPISYPISQNAMTHTWILRPFRDTYFQFPSFQWRLLLVRSWSNWSRDLSKTIAFCIQWIGLREILNRKPMGFYHQIHGVFRWFFSLNQFYELYIIISGNYLKYWEFIPGNLEKPSPKCG
jgi:hypothetical protein